MSRVVARAKWAEHQEKLVSKTTTAVLLSKTVLIFGPLAWKIVIHVPGLQIFSICWAAVLTSDYTSRNQIQIENQLTNTTWIVYPYWSCVRIMLVECYVLLTHVLMARTRAKFLIIKRNSLFLREDQVNFTKTPVEPFVRFFWRFDDLIWKMKSTCNREVGQYLKSYPTDLVMRHVDVSADFTRVPLIMQVSIE